MIIILLYTGLSQIAISTSIVRGSVLSSMPSDGEVFLPDQLDLAEVLNCIMVYSSVYYTKLVRVCRVVLLFP